MTKTPLSLARECAQTIRSGGDMVQTIAGAIERYGASRAGERLPDLDEACVHLTDAHAETLRLLETRDSLTMETVAQQLGLTRDAAYRRLERLAKTGHVRRLKRGVYVLGERI